MQYCNIQTRYLANEKRDKAAAVAALEELKAASSRQKEALETRIAKVKASKAKAVRDLKFDCESMKRWIDNLTSEIKCIDSAAAASAAPSSASTAPSSASTAASSASSAPVRPSLSGLLPQSSSTASGGADVKEVELSALYTVFMEVMREKKLLQVRDGV
jgi:hypothetical protein